MHKRRLELLSKLLLNPLGLAALDMRRRLKMTLRAKGLPGENQRHHAADAGEPISAALVSGGEEIGLHMSPPAVRLNSCRSPVVEPRSRYEVNS